MTQPDLDFDGSTFKRELDSARLSTQLGRVLAVMSDGHWRTLEEIQTTVGGSVPGVSARLRDLRKPRFGFHTVERRRRGDPTQGVFEYRLASGADT